MGGGVPATAGTSGGCASPLETASFAGDHGRRRALLIRITGSSIWPFITPSPLVGEVGAATLPAMLAMLLAGARKDYLPGPVFLGHLGNDDDKRASFAARATTPQTLALETRAEEKFGQKRRSALV